MNTNQIKTVNVIVMTKGLVEDVYSFNDNPEGNIEAEEKQLELAKQNGYDSSATIDDFFEDFSGTYEYGDYMSVIVHS